MAKIKPSTDPKALRLRIARFFEKYPDRWTRNRLAADKNRETYYGLPANAYCVCSVGALDKFTAIDCDDPVRAKAARALEAAFKNSGITKSLVDWNDSRGPRGVGVVARMFRKAAEAI